MGLFGKIPERVSAKGINLDYTAMNEQSGQGLLFFLGLNPLPNNQILDLSKLKEFADNKINMTQKLKFALGRVKNIVGKGYQHFSPFPTMFFFSPFPTMFSKGYFVRVVDRQDCVVKS